MFFFKPERSYSRQKLKSSLRKKRFFIFIIFLFIFLYIDWIIFNFKSFSGIPFSSIFFVILGIFLGFFIVWANRKIDNYLININREIGISREGDKGERLVYLELIKSLDDRYKIYKNFKIPGRIFDIDFLIVGPQGIIALEVKNSSCSYIFEEKVAIRIKGEGYSHMRTQLYGNCDPRLKLVNHCKSLDHYLFTSGFKDIKARKVILFVKGNISIKGRSGVYIINGLQNLGEYFQSLSEDKKFNKEFCDSINKKILGVYTSSF